MLEQELKLAKQQGRQEAIAEMTEIIKTEKLWKTQDEGFVGALDWMLNELSRLDERETGLDPYSGLSV